MSADNFRPNYSGALDARVSLPAFRNEDEPYDAISTKSARWVGGAHWLTARELNALPELSIDDHRQTGFCDLIGEVFSKNSLRTEGSSQVFLNGPGLLLTFGAPGGGKSSQISTQLLRPRQDSVIVLDVKGELYERCAPFLRQHMRVEQHGIFFSDPGASFNPIKAIPYVPPRSSHLCEAAIRAQTECLNLADDLIEQTLDQPFWVNAERALCAALLFHVKTAPLADAQTRVEKPYRVRMRTMAEVYRLLNLDREQTKHLIMDDMLGSPMPFVREGARSWHALIVAKDTYAAVHSDLLKQLSVWAHPVVDASSRECSYDFSSLRSTPTVVFLRVPPAQMKLCKPWMRAYFGTAIRHLMHETSGCGVTIYLDEAALLGTMVSFDSVIGAIRGYRIRLNCYYQSIGQLRSSYPKTWETWLSTSFSKVFFAVNDVDTADLVSRSIGDTTVAVPSFQVGESDGKSKSTTNTTAETLGSQRGTSSGDSRTWTGDRYAEGSNTNTNNLESEARQWSEGSTFGSNESQTRATTWTYTRRRLLEATEVMTLKDGFQIVLTPRGPILAHMARYFENDELVARATGDSSNALPSPSYAVRRPINDGKTPSSAETVEISSATDCT